MVTVVAVEKRKKAEDAESTIQALQHSLANPYGDRERRYSTTTMATEQWPSPSVQCMIRVVVVRFQVRAQSHNHNTTIGRAGAAR
jgi:hypothetical protein